MQNICSQVKDCNVNAQSTNFSLDVTARNNDGAGGQEFNGWWARENIFSNFHQVLKQIWNKSPAIWHVADGGRPGLVKGPASSFEWLGDSLVPPHHRTTNSSLCTPGEQAVSVLCRVLHQGFQETKRGSLQPPLPPGCIPFVPPAASSPHGHLAVDKPGKIKARTGITDAFNRGEYAS